MAIIDKYNSNFLKDDGVTVKGRFFKADYKISFPIQNDDINIDNCTCIFSILDRGNPIFRKYVGGKFYENLNNGNIIENINGYLPETVYCFTDSSFPLKEFLDENNFKHFGS